MRMVRWKAVWRLLDWCIGSLKPLEITIVLGSLFRRKNAQNCRGACEEEMMYAVGKCYCITPSLEIL
jgi:hypothetical protein